MANNKHNQWELLYRQETTEWDRGETNPQLQDWLDRKELQPCRILVPGCGNGHEVLALAAAGFDVVAIDIATTPVDRLREQLLKQNLTAEIIQGDLLNWKTETKFDAIYEQTCLCALNPDSWQLYEQQLYDWLTLQGKIFTLFMQINRLDGPPFHCELSSMRALFPDVRWNWHNEETSIAHPAGFNELAYIVEKI